MTKILQNKKVFAAFLGIVFALSAFQFAGASLNSNYTAIKNRQARFADTTTGGAVITAPDRLPVVTPTPTPAAPCAIIRPVSAVASAVLSAPTDAVKAIDNDVNTMWNSGQFATQETPVWIELNLGAVYDVQGLRVHVAQNPDASSQPKPAAPFHVILTGEKANPTTVSTTLHKDLYNKTWEEVSFNTVATRTQYVRVLTKSSPSWVAWYELEVCGNPSGPVVTLCPQARVQITQLALTVGQTTTVSAPANWYGGSFHTTNPQVVTVNGTTITAVAAGTASIYGMGFRVGQNWPCTADAVMVTVTAPQIQPFIGGYGVVSTCMSRMHTISAVSPVPAEIRFTELRLEKTPANPGNYTGPRVVTLTKQADGVYRGSITVSTNHFPAGTAAIFRLFSTSGVQIHPGYGAVSHDYDAHCGS